MTPRNSEPTFNEALVSRPSSAWHKWALLATDEISNTEPLAAFLGDRTAQSVHGRGREKYAAYFQDGTLGRVLSTMNPEWPARMAAEQHGALIPTGKPDIVLRNGTNAAVVIKTEYLPAPKVED